MKYSFLLPYYNRKEFIVATLDSFEYFYGGRTDFEVIIVDDVSADNHRLEDVLNNYSFKIILKRLLVKNGINPCVPYNVAARLASGENLILTSPETLHTSSILDVVDREGLRETECLVFSVFCPTEESWNDRLLRPGSFPAKMEWFDGIRHHMYEGLGEGNRPPFNNLYGSWYLHSQHRPSNLNFLTVIKKDVYEQIGGFREEFRFGTGYDDNDFLDRLQVEIKEFRYFDAACALHLNHRPVHSGNPTSNYDLYHRLKGQTYTYNDKWGRQA
jgi:glycosyltransferase involved in cell wall biosynthesis